MTPIGKAEWPRFTKVQEDLMLRLDSSPHGYLIHQFNRTYLRLNYEGMVEGETILSSFVTITRRGRDYVRFGLKRRATRPERKEGQ